MTPLVFADASGGVKRYIDEPGTALARSVDELVFAELSRVEIASAIWRKRQDGLITDEETADVLDEFEADWYGTDQDDAAFVLIGTASRLLALAAQLLGRHGLRTGDAVQLASALTARQVDPDVGTFLCFDQRLRAAARTEGFALLPAEL